MVPYPCRGSWYTFGHTLSCFILCLVHFGNECKTKASDRHWSSTPSFLHLFAAWCAVYVCLGLNVLTSSQMYHHDAEESKEGLRCMAMVLPFSVGAALVVLHQALDSSRSFLPPHTTLKKGQVCEVVHEHQQRKGDGSESVMLGDLVKMLQDESSEGW